MTLCGSVREWRQQWLRWLSEPKDLQSVEGNRRSTFLHPSSSVFQFQRVEPGGQSWRQAVCVISPWCICVGGRETFTQERKWVFCVPPNPPCWYSSGRLIRRLMLYRGGRGDSQGFPRSPGWSYLRRVQKARSFVQKLPCPLWRGETVALIAQRSVWMPSDGFKPGGFWQTQQCELQQEEVERRAMIKASWQDDKLRSKVSPELCRTGGCPESKPTRDASNLSLLSSVSALGWMSILVLGELWCQFCPSLLLWDEVCDEIPSGFLVSPVELVFMFLSGFMHL